MRMSYLDKSALKVVGTRPIRPDGVDKVTGRANFGADMVMPGMLWGRIKRSPYAHARIISIDVAKALALPGVKAVVTRADFPDVPPEKAHIGAAPHNLRDLSLNCMAKGKALYEGHAVAAVAATSPAITEQRYTTKPVHQAYIEPHACLVSVGADGQCTIWSSSQGQFMVRAYTSRICGADIASIRAIPAEIGGGFGGKTIIYLEPVAYLLSKKSGRPGKMV